MCFSELQCIAFGDSPQSESPRTNMYILTRIRRLGDSHREVGGWGRVPFSRNFMSPTPRRKWYLTTGRRAHQMVLDPIPQSLPVHFFGSRPQPPTSRTSSCVAMPSKLSLNRSVSLEHKGPIFPYFWPYFCGALYVVAIANELSLPQALSTQLSLCRGNQSPYFCGTLSQQKPRIVITTVFLEQPPRGCYAK